ncbi:MAG: VWA domain-containing protein [Pseudonocardiales bacterium]|nr:VWA domain-containing protein [Pseudonocardiales bacterium]
MTEARGFTIDIDQNSYLPVSGSQVDAIVTVTMTEATDTAPPTDNALEIIIVDCSTSMSGDKIVSARRATEAAIAELREGVSFTVIAGTETAEQVYPSLSASAMASARTRAEATAQVQRLQADGGTGIGAWLRLAAHIADQHPGAVNHAILLTDGQNGEHPSQFAAALQDCVGKFTCDCRGVGTDWEVQELRAISSTLLGSVDIVADPADLAADFRAIMGTAMGKRLSDVALRLWTPPDATVQFVKQVAPTVEDLTSRRIESGKRTGDYPLGSWGAETRDYHIKVHLTPRHVGEKILAARVKLIQTGSDEELAQGLITATWTDDSALSTRISRGVAHYTGQVELATAIQDGLTARKAGDQATATARLGRAVALAAASGNDASAQLLERVVEVIDAPSGTVRLRAEVTAADEMTLDTRSTKTVRVRGGS